MNISQNKSSLNTPFTIAESMHLHNCGTCSPLPTPNSVLSSVAPSEPNSRIGSYMHLPSLSCVNDNVKHDLTINNANSEGTKSPVSYTELKERPRFSNKLTTVNISIDSGCIYDENTKN